MCRGRRVSRLSRILAALAVCLLLTPASLAAAPESPDPAAPPTGTPGRADGRPVNALKRDALPPNATEWCALVIGAGGITERYNCVLFLMPPGAEKPDPKHLTILGVNSGWVVTDLLPAPRTIDATDQRAVVRGQGQTRDGKSRQVDVQPQYVSNDCGIYGGYVDIFLYDGGAYNGDVLCLTATSPPEGNGYLGDFGWNDRMSSWKMNDYSRRVQFYLDAWYASYWGTTCTSAVPCQAAADGTKNNKLSSVYIYVP